MLMELHDIDSEEIPLVSEPCDHCGEITCIGCKPEEDFIDNGWGSYPEMDEEYIEWIHHSDDSESVDIILEEEMQPFTTIPYTYSAQEIRDIYTGNIKITQVIANQPINRGGNRCTPMCDTENHHVHTYCKACKHHLPYRTIIHDCLIGFESGKIHPDR